MKLWRILTLTGTLLLTPVLAGAKPVLSAGELSVGAEFHPFNGLSTLRTDLDVAGIRETSPMIGFNLRYAVSQQLAAYGNFAFFHRIQDGPDPATFYAIGGGIELDFISTRSTAGLLKAGLQFLPRRDGNEQDFGVRFFVGPGVEARVADALSLQIYSPLFDLGIGGQSTTFDFNLIPNLALFVYF